MFITLNISQLDLDCVYLCKSSKNNVLQGDFTRILYSNALFSLNSIYLTVPLNTINIDINYNKIKISFNTYDNNEIIEKIKNIEKNILKKIENYNKCIQTKIYDQLMSKNIIIYKNDNSEKINKCNIILKISGIWETDNNIGLTYKFLSI